MTILSFTNYVPIAVSIVIISRHIIHIYHNFLNGNRLYKYLKSIFKTLIDSCHMSDSADDAIGHDIDNVFSMDKFVGPQRVL